MKIQQWCLLSLALLLVFSFPVSATMEMREEDSSYIFDTNLHSVDAPIAYTVTEMLGAEDFGESSSMTPEDLSVGYDGSIFVADSAAGKVYKLSEDRQTVTTLHTFQMGETIETLQEPVSVFARRDGTVFVADSGTRRVYVFDENFQYQRHLEPITNEQLLSDQDYVPMKVCADRSDRIYVIARNQTQGILQFSPEGEFTGYLGATRVTPSVTDLLLRKFATKEQRKKMLRLIPTEYNNMAVDEDDYIYASVGALEESKIAADISSNGTSATPVRRLNPKGIDTLIRNAKYPPVGDVNFTSARGTGIITGASRMVDVACRVNNVYSLLDSTRGRVFTYDRTGELLFVFGNSGVKKEALVTPSAIDYWGDSLVVSDLATGLIKVFSPTEYGKKILKAVDYRVAGEFDSEEAIWNEIRREYIGSSLAYLNLGKAAMEIKDYEEAMEYFRLTNDKENYSKAYEAYRKQWGYQNIGWLVAGGIAVCLLIYAVSYVVRKMVLTYEGNPRTLGQRVFYAKYVMSHPFKGFYDLKIEHIGTVSSATMILLAVLVLQLIQMVFKPYLLQSESNGREFIQGAYGVALLVGLFVVANWCLTTLMDGKGTFKDIYIYTCYSLFPMLLFLPIQIVFGQVVSLDEIALYEFLGNVAVVLVVFLIFIGTIVVHEYSAAKAVGVLVMTVVGMMILVFIVMLCFTLSQQVVIFIDNIVTELRLR